MKTKIKIFASAIFFLCFILLISCGPTLKLKTFVDPSLQASSIKSIAVFPMRNAAFDPGETMDINRGITQGFQQKNSGVKIIGASESVEMLNQHGLVDKFSNMLGVFESSGIPNATTLKEIGEKLGINAILQGRLSDVSQQDGHWGAGAEVGQTSLTIRYTLLSTKDGAILWEGICSATKKGGAATTKAPPLYQVALLAQNKIITSIPLLGK